ncbi:hypothetical protein [Alkalibacter mobilis]|uniref:hypothetical protein n=1 Tax=Alkalibacter mobilis TaxID=2787712 RepID=UPI00189D7944|nr:hypothetical protein [Alkalibacter mobilis]MBF7095557.1 hypothetical protein [Alkalibacter mobilis]
MNGIKKIMQGRYGGDQLSFYILGLAMIMTLLGNLFSTEILLYISYLPLGIAVYRIFSKDINKRRMENYKFHIWISPLYSKLQKLKSRIRDRKNYKYFKCESCSTTLRVPKGKNKIIVTCPKCNTKSIKKT